MSDNRTPLQVLEDARVYFRSGKVKWRSPKLYSTPEQLPLFKIAFPKLDFDAMIEKGHVVILKEGEGYTKPEDGKIINRRKFLDAHYGIGAWAYKLMNSCHYIKKVTVTVDYGDDLIGSSDYLRDPFPHEVTRPIRGFDMSKIDSELYGLLFPKRYLEYLKKKPEDDDTVG